MGYSDLLQGAYDIHVHAAPDVIPRAMSLGELFCEVRAAGMAGMVIKDHCTTTVGRVAVLNELAENRCRFFSSIALNPPLGGLNPTAVEAALRAGADVVFFPTYGARHHIELWGAGKPPTAFPLPLGRFDGLTILDDQGRLKPQVLAILDLIAAHPAVLATGHMAPAESLALLHRAHAQGLRRLLVTHATESVSAFSVDQLRRAISCGAMIEHAFFATTPGCPGSVSHEALAEMIRAVGVRHCILSSDFGQPANGDPVIAFGEHLEQMAALGFSREEIRQMVCDNPRQLLSP